MFSNPFIDAGTGFNEGQRFPLTFPVFGASPSHPNNTVDWAPFLPISGMVAVDIHNVSPYAKEYNLSLQRQLGRRYRAGRELYRQPGPSPDGSGHGQSRHSRRLPECEPAQPGGARVSAVCGPFSETGTFTTVSGQVVNGRGPFGANFGSDGPSKSRSAIQITTPSKSPSAMRAEDCSFWPGTPTASLSTYRQVSQTS